MVLQGRGGHALPLNDERFFSITASLRLEDAQNGSRLKVLKSRYQYQTDADPDVDSWVFRYEFLREPADPHPAAHLHVRGALTEPVLPANVPLGRIHFPTDRISLEAVIRCLAEQFGVPCNTDPEIWRAVLTESEAIFAEIAHRPRSGPAS